MVSRDFIVAAKLAKQRSYQISTRPTSIHRHCFDSLPELNWPSLVILAYCEWREVLGMAPEQCFEEVKMSSERPRRLHSHLRAVGSRAQEIARQARNQRSSLSAKLCSFRIPLARIIRSANLFPDF
jgi:hypothetical protein